MKRISAITAVCACIYFVVSCVICTPFLWAADRKASFIPHWSPQAQFAGYFVAYEKGFYKKRGIDLTVKEGGPTRITTEILEKNEADFVSMWLSTAIQKRSEGVKLINICQVIQRSALMLVAKKSKGITRPEDMAGKKIGLWSGDFRLQPLAFLRKHHLDVKIIPQGYTVNLFLRDGVDVVSAMWYNEYHTIINAGVEPEELTTFFFYDYGLNFPEDGIYVMESTYRKDPQLACDFAQASMEGWQYSFDHPDEALAIVIKYMNAAKVPANKAQQRWMLARMKDIIVSEDGKDNPPWGLNKADYERVANELKKNGLIRKVPDYSAFFTGCVNNAEK